MTVALPSRQQSSVQQSSIQQNKFSGQQQQPVCFVCNILHNVAHTIGNVGHVANRIVHGAITLAGNGGDAIVNLANRGIKGAANEVTKIDPKLLDGVDGVIHRVTQAAANIINKGFNAVGDAGQTLVTKGTGFISGAVNEVASAIAPTKKSSHAPKPHPPAPRPPPPRPAPGSSGSSDNS